MISKDEIRTTLGDIRFYYANIKSLAAGDCVLVVGKARPNLNTITLLKIKRI